MKTELREIKRINVLSIAKVFLIFGLIMGLFQGISYAYTAKQTVAAYPEVASMTITDAQATGGSQAVIMLVVVKIGWWSLLIMPIAIAIFSWIGAVVSAWIYNMIAKKAGGIKVTLD